jgi:hypothetical protein
LGQLAYLDVLYWDALGLGRLGSGHIHPALLSSVVAGAVVSVFTSLLALAMVFRGKGERGSRPLGLALAAWGYLLAYSGITILLAPDPSSVLRMAFETHFLLVEAIGSAALLRFTAVFPQSLPASALEDPDELAIGLRTAQQVRRWLLEPWTPWATGVAAVLLILGVNAALGRPTQDAPLLLLTDLFRMAALALVILNLRRSFVVGDETARRQMFWLVVGFTLLLGAVGTLLGGNVLTTVTGWSLPSFNWRPVVLDLGVLGLIWGAAMAVFYRGPMKPGRLTRRLSVVASAATIALFLAAGMETLLAGAVASRMNFPPGVGTAVAFLAMGLLYVRIRGPLESMIYTAWAPEDRSVDRA